MQHFCHSLEEVEMVTSKFEALRSNVDKQNATDPMQTKSLVQQFGDHKENLAGGWIENVCQRATAKVTNVTALTLVKLLLAKYLAIHGKK